MLTLSVESAVNCYIKITNFQHTLIPNFAFHEGYSLSIIIIVLLVPYIGLHVHVVYLTRQKAEHGLDRASSTFVYPFVEPLRSNQLKTLLTVPHGRCFLHIIVNNNSFNADFKSFNWDNFYIVLYKF